MAWILAKWLRGNANQIENRGGIAMNKKFEKIVLTTCIETFDGDPIGMTALDQILPAIEKFATEVVIVDYDIVGEYELVKKPEKE